MQPRSNWAGARETMADWRAYLFLVGADIILLYIILDKDPMIPNISALGVLPHLRGSKSIKASADSIQLVRFSRVHGRWRCQHDDIPG